MEKAGIHVRFFFQERITEGVRFDFYSLYYLLFLWWGFETQLQFFSDRLSSRPLGWSVVGADKMAQLRVYKRNGRSMLELVRYQKMQLPMAAGAEVLELSAANILIPITNLHYRK